jgi:hypothetical protein
MTLFESALTWWRKAPSAPEGRLVSIRPAAPRVSARYLALFSYLDHRYASNVVLTFEQMESLLGFALPTPACTEPDWWTNSTGDMDGHSDAWTVARRIATPNLSARIVSFERLP